MNADGEEARRWADLFAEMAAEAEVWVRIIRHDGELAMQFENAAEMLMLRDQIAVATNTRCFGQRERF